MKEKIKVAVIGVGAIAQIAHLPVLASRDDVEITAVLAKHPEHALDAKRQYGAVHAVETMEALMELKPDCAFVLSPKANHPEQVVKLLENGISVLCEKPLAMTLKEAEWMADTAQKTGNMLMVGFNRRFAPVYRKAKEAYGDTAPDVVIAQKNRPASEYRATL